MNKKKIKSITKQQAINVINFTEVKRLRFPNSDLKPSRMSQAAKKFIEGLGDVIALYFNQNSGINIGD
jgi:hypothetical protein